MDGKRCSLFKGMSSWPRKNYSEIIKTLEAWLELLKEKETTISKIFAKEYGADKVVDQLNGWKLFYIMSR